MAPQGVVVLAHGLHYAVLVGGGLGLLLLLAPRFLPAPATPRDEHEARVRALREAVASGHLATLAPPVVARRPAGPVSRAGAVERTLVPLAVVGSAAAAGVHAAVGPVHFREGTLFGLFFAVSALAQVLWAGVATLRPGRGLLIAGALGNAAVLALWVVTRTAGLPFGLLPEPEVVGPWDVACGLWELLVVTACVAALRAGAGRAPVRAERLPDLGLWHPGVRAFALVSVLGLVALSFSGASA